ncbi:hypothetical protein J2T56_002716 [Natronobacillus azotifigens]
MIDLPVVVEALAYTTTKKTDGHLRSSVFSYKIVYAFSLYAGIFSCYTFKIDATEFLAHPILLKNNRKLYFERD